MDRFWEVASPGTWAVLIASTLCLLAGFVLLSHTRVRTEAKGDTWGGLRASGPLERLWRLGVALLAAGLGLWAFELGAGPWVTGAAAAVALAAAALELLS